MARKNSAEKFLMLLIGIVIVLAVLIVFSGVASDKPDTPETPDLPPVASVPDEPQQDVQEEVGDEVKEEIQDEVKEEVKEEPEEEVKEEPKEEPKEEVKEPPKPQPTYELPDVEPADLTGLYEAHKYISNAIFTGQSLSCTKNGILYKVSNDDKKIALTFDDGPAGSMTLKYLSVLAEYDAKATFFLQGQEISKFPEQAKKIAEFGHEVGSHSWAHHDLSKKDKDFIKSDFEKTANVFQEVFGHAPALFRPPYGATNSDMFTVSKGYGLLYVMWNNDKKDYLATDADELADSIINSVTSGAVILMHENKKVTLAALPKIITELQAKGYEFVTLSELVYDVETANDQQEAATE